MLTRQGVTAWHRALTDLDPTPSTAGPIPGAATSLARAAAGTVPPRIAAELVNALAAVVLAGT